MESKNYNEDLSHIRNMMERSSKFISLSGLSGVVAGLIALIGGGFVFYLFQQAGFNYFEGKTIILSNDLVRKLFFTGIAIAILAIVSGYIFTAKKSRKTNSEMWNSTTKRLLLNFAIPLVTGGIFCLALLYNHLFVFIAPATLIFYGLALLNAEKYTFSDVKYLGYCQIILGLISMFFLGWGLVFWMLGFGILHIFYGLVMYKKYK